MLINPDPAVQRDAVLAKLASVTSMERGTLTEEYREHLAPNGPGTIRSGPYFKHQCWEKGRNRSVRVPAQCVDMLREDLENAQRFDELTARLAGLAVENSRARRAALSAEKERASGIAAKKNSRRSASKKDTVRQKPSSPRSTRSLPKKA